MSRSSLTLALVLLLAGSPAFAESEIRQRATEEIIPGVRVRGGGLVIEVDPHCGAGCPDGQQCQEVCRVGACDARSNASDPCRHCAWECVE